MGGIRIAHAVALVALLGCSRGGQSSDDGAPLDGGSKPHQPPEDAGPREPDADTPDPTYTVIVVPTLDGHATYGCGAGFTAAQLLENGRAAIVEAPYSCSGNDGYWSCTCEGRMAISRAFGCEAGLFEACGVAAEATDGSGTRATAPGACQSTATKLSGRCQRLDDGDYSCTCGDARDEPTPPVVVAVDGEAVPASCELALFRACATPCGGEYGACDPEDEAIRSYACACTTHGLSLAMLETDCDFALTYACSPISVLDETCTGYGGYCRNTDPIEYTTMRCSCADGSEHDVEHTPYWLQPRPYSCRETLEETCGLGSPPAGAQCLGDGNGHRARCTRGPGSDGPLTCECYLEGDPGSYVHGASLASETCDRALLEDFCPAIAPLPSGASEAACDHYSACERPMVGFERETCIESVSDACAACVIGERARMGAGADGCPMERIQCFSPCETIVPRETGVAACEQNLEALQLLTPEASCLCDRCYPAFGNCIADEGCREILDCATSEDCDAATCTSDPVCGPLITQYQGTPSFALIVAFSSCEQKDSCRE